MYDSDHSTAAGTDQRATASLIDAISPYLKPISFKSGSVRYWSVREDVKPSWRSLSWTVVDTSKSVQNSERTRVAPAEERSGRRVGGPAGVAGAGDTADIVWGWGWGLGRSKVAIWRNSDIPKLWAVDADAFDTERASWSDFSFRAFRRRSTGDIADDSSKRRWAGGVSTVENVSPFSCRIMSDMQAWSTNIIYHCHRPDIEHCMTEWCMLSLCVDKAVSPAARFIAWPTLL